ncbi:hypothetical protein D3C79_1058900 [compost metagenome]
MTTHQGQQLDLVDERNLLTWVRPRTELADVVFVDAELVLSRTIGPGNAEVRMIHVASLLRVSFFLRPLSLI